MNPERWAQINRLYDSTLALEPGQREAFLHEACAGDESLFEEVRSLLAQKGHSEGFFESPALEAVAKDLAKDQLPSPPPDLAGQTLSHYRIEKKIGEGGMGEVYRAEDTILGRRVAIKILPGVFAGDPERLARFEREAKLLAALNHPNIAAIYGLEQGDGKRFLVLELVEGRTLAERLHKGPLPVEESLEVCRQIAEGLEAAHDKGIIHRDLKPSNVKVTPEGKVRILDFGLARALHDQAATVDLSHSPTITDEMTRPGVVLGTAAYMSPEQATGKIVDKRTDIWAFGCVLYECLTAKRAFRGETITETLASILKSEPDWTLLPTNTPLFVRAVLRQCLRKDPNVRLHDVADAWIEMQGEIGMPEEDVPAPQRARLGRLAAACTITLAVGVLTGALAMRYFNLSVLTGSQPVVRASIQLGPGKWLEGWRWSPPAGFDLPTRTALSISSDGRFIVFSAVKENPGPQDNACLYLRRLDQLEARPIPGTEGGINPFLSPDDHWVGFWAEGKLKTVPVDGGVPTVLCEVPAPFGFSWGTDNHVVFAQHHTSGLSRVVAGGGKIEMLTVPDKSKGEYGHRLPHCLPNGSGIFFTIMRSFFDLNPRVAVWGAATRKSHVLLENAADARYVATGHLAFLRQGTLMVVPFDLDRLAVTGEPVPAVANVMQALNGWNAAYDTAAGQYGISASGTLVYAQGGILPDRESSLVWVDRKGRATPTVSFRAPFFSPRLSPDGQSIAYLTLERGKSPLWLYDLNRDTATKLWGAGDFTWTPNSRRLAFGWSKTGPENIYWQAADGSSPMERLTTSELMQSPGSWTPDGKTLAFVERNIDNVMRIMLLHMPDRKITPLADSRFSGTYPEFSPDGRWLAYVSDESGGSKTLFPAESSEDVQEEVYVRQFPGPGSKWQVSSGGGSEPLWSPDGKKLFYCRCDEVWVVDVQAGSSLSPGKPRLLFEQPGYGHNFPHRGWDISADGQKFLMVQGEDRNSRPVTEIILVQNWFEELKRLCPTGKN